MEDLSKLSGVEEVHDTMHEGMQAWQAALAGLKLAALHPAKRHRRGSKTSCLQSRATSSNTSPPYGGRYNCKLPTRTPKVLPHRTATDQF